MKNNSLILIVVIILVLGGGYLYLKNQKQMSQPAAKIEQKGKSTTPQSTTAVKEISMTAKQWEFMPSEVRVKQGETVKLKVKSVDVTHGFSLPDFNIDEKLEPGKEVIVEFVANKKGAFTFFCSVLCGQGHKDMKGTLVVE